MQQYYCTVGPTVPHGTNGEKSRMTTLHRHSRFSRSVVLTSRIFFRHMPLQSDAWRDYATGANSGSDLRGIDCWQMGRALIYAHRAREGCVNEIGHGSTGALYVECPPQCTGPQC